MVLTFYPFTYQIVVVAWCNSFNIGFVWVLDIIFVDLPKIYRNLFKQFIQILSKPKIVSQNLSKL